MAEAVNSESSVSTKLQRIAELARRHRELSFTSLAHYIDIEWLKEAYRRTRKDGAPGIDGQTGADYAANLEANLQSLLDRAKSGRYRAPAVRRVYIPKGDGKDRRPLGVPTFEDKVLQRAVAMVMGAVYEQDFLPCSHGFRTGRSPRTAVEQLWKQLMSMGGCVLVEVDLRKYFDTVDHGQLREIVRQRVCDGVLNRLLGKWLNAGVLEEGRLWYPESGTPQGGVASPLLANVYLHTVLDVWFHEEVQPRLRGQSFLVRYADDFVVGFADEEDARRFLAVLPKRFEKYGLSLHPTKTRVVDFRRPPGGPGGDRERRSRTFDFLGFTHYWGRSRKGAWVVKKKTAADRLRRAVRSLSQWCRAHRHEPIQDQHAGLCRRLRGHDQYYGVTGNWSSLTRLRYAVLRRWKYWLDRRSQTRSMTWARLQQWLLQHPLTPPRIYWTG